MVDVHIRIYFRESDGTLEDSQQEFDIESFAGVIPAIGDMIVDPGVLQGLNRHDPKNRRVWDVVGRVFNPRDMVGYVALVVEERAPNLGEYGVVAG
ncbi:hypothetical protein [Novosphingobium profundi]|uniref:hypothetical protein n=1 Tax=Novosphingobium profundi TaxID=1774954 RepID=UPI001CFD2935|nr:hypothetical protein [Novosphingobium profundi]